MILRKCCSVIRSAAAAQRNTIFPSRQRHTRRVLNRTPLFGLSITLVETRQRERRGDKPSSNISSKPSRRLGAALGYSRSSHSACFSSFPRAFLRRQPERRPHHRLHLILQL